MPPKNDSRIPLCVPTWDEKEIFNLGGEYAKDIGFYVPAKHLFPDDFFTWLPRRFKDTVNPPYLVPEMLPVTTWEDNLRTRLTTEHWDRLRRYCYRAAGGVCEICGCKNDGPLECHEEWKFDDVNKVQKLKRLLALCTLCHKAHHLGFARRTGIYLDVLAHLKWVNGWSDAQLNPALAEAEDICDERSRHTWKLDISWVYSVNGYRYV
jgi:hypothetical protein